MAKIIKNIDTVEHTYGGQGILAGESYTLQASEDFVMIKDDSLIADIAAGKAQLNNGISDIVGTANQLDFLRGEIKEVTTQFEKRDKTVKLASAQADVGEDSLVTILIKSPGTPGTADGRWISGGIAWFDDPHKDDRIISVEFTDEDNVLGYGAGAVIGSYTDNEAPSEQQGWRIPSKRGMIEVEALGGYGFAPAGFYLKLVGKKGGSLTTGTLYVNIEWGKQE